jgi:hypothetical protein
MPKKKSKKKVDFIENFCNFSVLLPWKECVKILINHYGCEMVNKPGSKRLFIKDQFRVTADEPHGREKYVSKWDRKRICTHLIKPLESLKGDK